ncbi:MAG: hypothetical protein IJ491_04475 [Clostridia bacterium]|nr:hypothetical protein [Clostridia bacterium]
MKTEPFSFLADIQEGFEQGGSEAEEKAPVELFRRRGNERSEAIGAGAPGQNPLQRAIRKRGSVKTEPFSFFINLTKVSAEFILFDVNPICEVTL